MKTIKIGILVIFFMVVACCNENENPQPSNILKGKLKTFEDNRYRTGEDSIIRFYLLYDSLYGYLKNVSIKTKFNGRDTLAPFFTIYKENSSYMFAYIYLISSTPGVQKFRINTIDNRITSVVEMDTFNNTENIVANTIFIGNNIDSAYNAGYFLNYNIRFSSFLFSNQNCSNYKVNYIEQQISPPYNTINRSSQLTINYTNHLIKNKLFSQNCMDISASINYGLLLYFLSADGFYIIPQNQNLIGDITIHTQNYDTSIIRYNYQFTGTDVTVVERTYFSLSDTTNKTLYHQKMSYY